MQTIREIGVMRLERSTYRNPSDSPRDPESMIRRPGDEWPFVQFPERGSQPRPSPRYQPTQRKVDNGWNRTFQILETLVLLPEKEKIYTPWFCFSFNQAHSSSCFSIFSYLYASENGWECIQEPHTTLDFSMLSTDFYCWLSIFFSNKPRRRSTEHWGGTRSSKLTSSFSFCEREFPS